MIKLDLTNALKEEELLGLSELTIGSHRKLHEKTGKGAEMLGWLDWPLNYDKEEFGKIKESAQFIKDNCEIFLVIGIGGSYLGARAGIEMLSHSFNGFLSKEKRKAPIILFAGINLSSSYHHDLLEIIEDKDICVNVVSKSGTTTEPAVAFRFIRELMEKKYGNDGAAKRIFATTDKRKGTLKKLADEKGYTTFVVPDDMGGRYSVLSAVGMLPIAAAGIDIDEVMQGAADAYLKYAEPNLAKNECYQYAAARYFMYKNMGKKIEILVNYEPKLHYFAEWWKQLFGESEGKEGKGIFPTAVDFTTDLHSLGQLIQQGERNIFETVLNVLNPAKDMELPYDPQNSDGLNFLAGKTLNYINTKAFEGTLVAHTDAGVPNIVITLEEISPYCFGEMVYFFEKACGMSGYHLDVNPFDQPGVEAYKNNMYALLGKPGYEELKNELEMRLKNDERYYIEEK